MLELQALMILLGCGYVAAVVWLVSGLRRAAPTVSGTTPDVSVIIAARNEEASISTCLRALQLQEYAGEIEVVVVDDRSSDRTGQILREIAAGWPALKPVPLGEGEGEFECPKKSALARGIAASSGELLMFTDADCEPPPAWVRITASLFTDGVGLVAGYARPRRTRWLRHRVLALDNLAVSALAAGSIGNGAVLSCTGRNLAYRRRLYDEAGGYASIGHLVAGDDVYFARLVARATDWRMAYCRDPAAVVACGPGPESWSGLMHQKLRHASKAGHYRGAAKLLGAAVYLFHLTLLWGVVQTFLFEKVPPAFPAVWGFRWLIDYLLLQSFAPASEDRRLIPFLPILEFLYIPYVLLFVPAGTAGWFRWREDEAEEEEEATSS